MAFPDADRTTATMRTNARPSLPSVQLKEDPLPCSLGDGVTVPVRKPFTNTEFRPKAEPSMVADISHGAFPRNLQVQAPPSEVRQVAGEGVSLLTASSGRSAVTAAPVASEVDLARDAIPSAVPTSGQ
ncbi:unnamed protein product, partial [Chrysoparadoxa australica]